MFTRTIFFSRRSRRVSKERPKTATLPHPQVLDETLKDKVAILDQVCWYFANTRPTVAFVVYSVENQLTGLNILDTHMINVPRLEGGTPVVKKAM